MLRATFVYHEERTGDIVKVVHTAPAYDPREYAATTPELMDLMAANYSPGDGWKVMHAEARDGEGKLLYSRAIEPAAVSAHDQRAAFSFHPWSNNHANDSRAASRECHP